jgi:adenine phosphoribosyltransferase
MDFKRYIEDVKDFPKEGIVYKDIQPLLEDDMAFNKAITQMSEMIELEDVDYFVGIESRGFIFAAALAMKTGTRFKMIRKAGKLPDRNHVLHRVKYGLEYGEAEIEMKPGWGNVVLVDDVYATGGTMTAAEGLATMSGYDVIDKLCLLDIGIKKGHDVKCLVEY